MNKFKKVMFSAFTPPVWFTLLCSVCSFSALIFVFIKGYDNTVFAYVTYFFSAYSLCILIINIVPNASAFANKIISKVPIAEKFKSDKAFRAHSSIIISLADNTVYSVFYAVTAVIQKSYWLSALAIYNFVLTCMRFMLAGSYNKAVKSKNGKMRLSYELKTYRLCGILMLLMSASMTGIIELLIRDGKNAEGEIITITVAAYTFYCFIIAIINVVKFRRLHSPILSASKNVCFARALMSLFSLQITMFSQFGEDAASQYIMNIATGGAVCAICIITAVLMIIKANKNLKKIRSHNTY